MTWDYSPWMPSWIRSRVEHRNPAKEGELESCLSGWTADNLSEKISRKLVLWLPGKIMHDNDFPEVEMLASGIFFFLFIFTGLRSSKLTRFSYAYRNKAALGSRKKTSNLCLTGSDSSKIFVSQCTYRNTRILIPGKKSFQQPAYRKRAPVSRLLAMTLQETATRGPIKLAGR